MLFLFLAPVAFALLGFAIGRWWVATAAAATCATIAVFLVVNNGWYGAGWGDGGIAGNVFIAALTIMAAAAGVVGRRSRDG